MMILHIMYHNTWIQCRRAILIDAINNYTYITYIDAGWRCKQMDATTAEIGRNPMSKHHIQPECGE